MGRAKVLGDTAWRDWVTDGVPSTGEHQPPKSEIRAVIEAMDSETLVAPAIVTGAVTLDLNLGESFTIANNANAAVTFSNAPAGRAFSFDVLLTADGTLRAWTWPGSVVWIDGGAPVLTLTNGKRDWFAFKTFDGGTTWLGCVVGQGF